MYCLAEENNKDLKCHLLVNHDEQITVYEQIAEKLGLTGKYGKVVNKPTAFINNHSENEPVDEIVNMKMTMNEAKYPVEKAKGRADKYDQL